MNFISKLRLFFLKRIKINGLNPDSYQPLWGVEVSRLVLLSVLFLFFLLFFGLSILIVSYTPAKGLLPDSVRNTDRVTLEQQYLKIDSLMSRLEMQEKYISDVKKIILGEPLGEDIPEDTLGENTAQNLEGVSTDFSASERNLAEKVRDEIKEDQGFEEGHEKLEGLYFFPPVNGVLSAKMENGHLGVDVVTEEKATIKSVLDGTVIFSDWTNRGGRTVIVTHGNGYISVYMHASVLLKKAGDRVRGGDPVAIVGNSGENTTGPHLHFELIFNGKYVNPLNYISFK